MVADSLSRQYEELYHYLAFSLPHFGLVDELKQEYIQNSHFITLIHKLQSGESLKWDLSWKNDLLYFGTRLFLVPTCSLVTKLLYEFHSIPAAGHFGVANTYRCLASQFY